MLGSLETFEEPEGVLAPLEFSKLPFEPKRMFYVRNVPKGEERGKHAHHTTQQILICVQGEILVKLISRDTIKVYDLKPNEWVFVDKLVWDSQVFKTGNDVMISICSTPYDRSDYIEDFCKFMDIVGFSLEDIKFVDFRGEL